MLNVQTGAFRILKNRSALPISVVAAIHNVRVQDEINVPAMFSFSLNMMSSSGGWQDVDLDVFKPGDEITIFLGLDSLEQLISGDITAIEPNFSTTSSSATIRGFDRMYRLKFGTRIKTYEMLNDNEIVTDVAKASGLSVKLAGSPSTINKYVLQNNTSNYKFLMGRCKQLDYELLMADTTLVFRPSAEGNSPVKTLQFPRDVNDVNLNLKLPTMGETVTAVGYDVETNQIIKAVASSGTPQDKMGGTETGYQAADDFPSSGITLECPNISDPSALQAVADAQFQSNLKDFIEGGASLVGDSQLVAGVNVRLTGLSQRFDGTYYVTSSTHSYDDSSGYKTDIKIRRTGI
ncbi:phage late control D family protein [Collimonas silvisoli]|uniref:phage late control D family protein n=1 Tax=Collimonas silvisoli TaxID=2825884 RepID=UPI001B8D7A41|nr:phage late control D family protein [Collimonas silvisoli]